MATNTSKLLLIFCDGTGADGNLSDKLGLLKCASTGRMLIKSQAEESSNEILSDVMGDNVKEGSSAQNATNVLRLC